jgi:hypothetical protein
VTDVPVAGAEVTGLLFGHQVEILCFRMAPEPIGSFVVTVAEQVIAPPGA